MWALAHCTHLLHDWVAGKFVRHPKNHHFFLFFLQFRPRTGSHKTHGQQTIHTMLGKVYNQRNGELPRASRDSPIKKREAAKFRKYYYNGAYGVYARYPSDRYEDLARQDRKPFPAPAPTAP